MTFQRITGAYYFLTKMAMEKGPYTPRRKCPWGARCFGLSGAKSTGLVIERLTDRNNAVDGTFYDAIIACLTRHLRIGKFRPMLNNEATFTKLRQEMIQHQIIRRGISAKSVIAAMEKVPRHFFVSEALKSRAYEDYPLPIGKQQTISQPFIVAEMTQALQLTPDDRVLEVGTGSGYQAAILAQIAYRVYTVERIYALYKSARERFDQLQYHNIVTHYADGTTGWQEESPFDAIIVTAGAPTIPVGLVNQLAIGGRLVIPVGDQHSQDLVRIIRTESGVDRHTLGACRFVKLIGAHGWQPADE